ncbi:MAG: hypothetical protein H8E33_00035 [Candidatus Cloacimonetes bacterium]|nr:hypothetical protein [Candidatus Cloacimonadota bacterium]
MKKIVLIFVGMLLISSLAFGNEVSINFGDLMGDYAAWTPRYVGLDWAGDDYCVDFDLTDLIDGNELHINEAWKKLPLGDFANLSVGVIPYAFGKFPYKPSENLGITQMSWFGSALMMKFDGDFSGLGWTFYYADNMLLETYPDDYEDIGFRFTYAVADFDLGFSYKMNFFGEDDPLPTNDWEFDLEYTLMEKIDLDFQLYNIGDDDEDEMDYEALLSYAPGFDFPLLGKAIPYFGYFTRGDAEENNMALGFNFAPNDETFIKLEYLMDSGKDDAGNAIDAELNFQVGFTF